jgi:hypothetical protein
MMRNGLVISSCCAALLLFFTSCSVNWSLRPNFKEQKKVYLPLPENSSMRTGIDHEYYQALKNRIASIKNLKIVSNKVEADQILLIDFKKANLKRGPTSFTGSSASESVGGLAEGAYTAASLILDVSLSLESRNPRNGKTLWAKSFDKSVQFEASNRTLEAEGASSMPMINESREYILHRQLALDFARMAVDQLIEDF